MKDIENIVKRVYMQRGNYMLRYGKEPNAVIVGINEFKYMVRSNEFFRSSSECQFAFGMKIHRTLNENYLAVGFVEEEIKIE